MPGREGLRSSSGSATPSRHLPATAGGGALGAGARRGGASRRIRQCGGGAVLAVLAALPAAPPHRFSWRPGRSADSGPRGVASAAAAPAVGRRQALTVRRPTPVRVRNTRDVAVLCVSPRWDGHRGRGAAARRAPRASPSCFVSAAASSRGARLVAVVSRCVFPSGCPAARCPSRRQTRSVRSHG